MLAMKLKKTPKKTRMVQRLSAGGCSTLTSASPEALRFAIEIEPAVLAVLAVLNVEFRSG